MSRDSLTITLLLLVIVASGADITSDLGQGASPLHLAQEGLLLTLATALLGWILLSLRRQQQQIQRLTRELDEARQLPLPQDEMLLDARHRLADLMAKQFQIWGLSQSEKEVGQLLLKGLSLKEISLLRGTAEKTIRQQASAIYKKAGVSGRHGFAAWFIEDFL
ncbi:helix-turn-helix transcriptional regulator [Shewanella sedimentimangrovi]|uniref:DNA-binding response regulator n=1 Tax=Shewanella sedimentimangrovi TaxID=2814293 RepID=A0ABX7QYW0_9GAMM|nr:LuxR C-terminal-related transcriptional regulator [Shewanella sedimentimangrovi]QSX36732.1 DNA-binding response regulator [Shewanella sedimentimangrovi]